MTKTLSLTSGGREKNDEANINKRNTVLYLKCEVIATSNEHLVLKL